MIPFNIQPAFSTNPLDRMDYLRADIFSQLDSVTDRYVMISNGHVLLSQDDTCFITAAEIPSLLVEPPLRVFLGGCDGRHYLAVAIPAEQGGEFKHIALRELATQMLLPDDQLSILAQANSLISWHQSHPFCSKCGEKSLLTNGGWRRDCPSCGAKHFPRTDPVVIMLVTHGQQCLLGRSPQFTANHFSCLAGFMEPGETIEQAALRELREEVGLRGGRVRYLANQPWPFPSNLMIGVHIEAIDTQLSIDNNEIEAAMWVSKSDVKAVLSGKTDRQFQLPAKLAIARSLLEHWVHDL